MRIKPGKDGYVEGYAEVGDMEGSVAFCGEIPEGFGPKTCRCYRIADAVTLVPDTERLALMQAMPAMQDELAALLDWFAWYDTQVMQYQRAERLGEACDINIGKLDRQAAKNQARINGIKTILNRGQG